MPITEREQPAITGSERQHLANPLVEPADGDWVIGDPTVLLPEESPDGRWHMFAYGVMGIHHLTSEDGLTWRTRATGLFHFGTTRPFVFRDTTGGDTTGGDTTCGDTTGGDTTGGEDRSTTSSSRSTTARPRRRRTTRPAPISTTGATRSWCSRLSWRGSSTRTRRWATRTSCTVRTWRSTGSTTAPAGSLSPSATSTSRCMLASQLRTASRARGRSARNP